MVLVPSFPCVPEATFGISGAAVVFLLAIMPPLPLLGNLRSVEPSCRRPATSARDLIVDKSQMNDRLSKRYVRVRAEPLTGDQIQEFAPAVADTLYDIDWCSRCGICQAACPTVTVSPGAFRGREVLRTGRTPGIAYARLPAM